MQKTTLQDERNELLDIITQNAYFREKIILSSGKESDYYIDARLITLTPKGVHLIAQIMLDMVKDVEFDSV